MGYLKKLIKLQRTIKKFISLKKNKKNSANTISKKSLISFKTHSKFSDIQSMISMKSNKISLRGLFVNKKCSHKYIGARRENKKQGFGKIIWDDGSILLARFLQNKANGVCLFKNTDGCIFNGRILLI
jgi:hypothetical protein